MNKKILAVAVAALVGGLPVLASANATISGVLGYRLDVVDRKVQHARTHDLAVTGSEDIGNGLTGLYRFALTGVGINNDASFVGLRGDFGTLLLGRLDHPYRTVTNGYRVMGDTVATGNIGGERSFQTLSRVQSDGAIAYVSPNMSGFTFSAAVVPQTSKTTDATNSGTSLSNEFPFSVSLQYTTGPITLNAAYEDLEGASGALNYSIGMIGARYSAGGLMVGIMGEQRETNAAPGQRSVETTRIIVPVTYALTPSLTLLGTVMNTDRDQLGADRSVRQIRDTTDYALGLNYALSSRTSVRAAYAHSNKVSPAAAPATQNTLVVDEKDASGFSVFVRHAF